MHQLQRWGIGVAELLRWWRAPAPMDAREWLNLAGDIDMLVRAATVMREMWDEHDVEGVRRQGLIAGAALAAISLYFKNRRPLL
jgi:hypothetical protein